MSSRTFQRYMLSAVFLYARRRRRVCHMLVYCLSNESTYCSTQLVEVRSSFFTTKHTKFGKSIAIPSLTFVNFVPFVVSGEFRITYQQCVRQCTSISQARFKYFPRRRLAIRSFSAINRLNLADKPKSPRLVYIFVTSVSRNTRSVSKIYLSLIIIQRDGTGVALSTRQRGQNRQIQDFPVSQILVVFAQKFSCGRRNKVGGQQFT